MVTLLSVGLGCDASCHQYGGEPVPAWASMRAPAGTTVGVAVGVAVGVDVGVAVGVGVPTTPVPVMFGMGETVQQRGDRSRAPNAQ